MLEHCPKSKTTMVSMKWSLAHVEVVWYGETCFQFMVSHTCTNSWCTCNSWWGEKPTKFQWLRGSFNIIKKSFRINKTVLLHFLEKILTSVDIPCCFFLCVCVGVFLPKGAIASEGGWSYIIPPVSCTFRYLSTPEHTTVFTCRGIAAPHRGALWKRRALFVGVKSCGTHRSNIHIFLRQLLYTLRIIGPSKLAILRTLPFLYRFKPLPLEGPRSLG